MTEISLPLLASLLLIGTTSGFLGGMLGIGGGVVIVPALILLLEGTGHSPAEEITLIAVATSLSCIVFTSASAAYTQYRSGKVLWPLFRRLMVFFVLGSFCAGVLSPQLPAQALRVVIGLFLAFVALVMLTNWRPAAHRELPKAPYGQGIGFAGGLMSGIAGIAGGNVIVPTLVYFNTPIHNATATSSALGVPIAAAGALSYILSGNTLAGVSAWQLGYVDVSSFVVITAAAVLCAPLGVKFAHRVPADLLKRCFGVLLVFVAGRMVYSALSL